MFLFLRCEVHSTAYCRPSGLAVAGRYQKPTAGSQARTSAAVWLRLQIRYELEIAERELSERINQEVKVYHQPAARA